MSTYPSIHDLDDGTYKTITAAAKTHMVGTIMRFLLPSKSRCR